MVEYNRKRRKCSQYRKEEKVFIRYERKKNGGKSTQINMCHYWRSNKSRQNENTCKTEFINPVPLLSTSE